MNKIKTEDKYKNIIDKISGYEYKNFYNKGDVLPDGNICKGSKVEVIHSYCNSSFMITTSQLSRGTLMCKNCCGSYENSLEYFLKQKLGFNINEIWDHESNFKMPKYTHKASFDKVKIKCKEKTYHGSYSITVSNLVKSLKNESYGCPYCSKRSGKVHPRDSFAQYHIDNTDPDFLKKYWDYDKNTLNPWELSVSSAKKVWIKCQEKDYHGSYEILAYNLKISFNKGLNGCINCSNHKVHPLDSFGYHHFDKVQSWSPRNEISPFKVARSSGKKYKFICDSCGIEFEKALNNLINRDEWCKKCSMSKGERVIFELLSSKNIKYIHDEPYFKDLLSNKGNPLRPDFILPDHKIWIEYDGEFHYKDMTGTLKITKYHDELKDEYAQNNGWKMIRIPYWEFDNIEDILERELIAQGEI